MSVSFAPSKLRIPPGFEALLEGLCRQVLKEQPEQVIPFAAEYFAAKLQARNDTHRRGAAGVSKPNGGSDQALLENGTSPRLVESPILQEETETPASYVECDDALKGTDVAEGTAAPAQDESMDDEPNLAVVDPEREDVSDVDKVNQENAEAPQTTDASSDRANDRETEVAEADPVVVEPSGEVSSGLTGEKDEVDPVTDPESAQIIPQSAASDGGVDEHAGGTEEGNDDVHEPLPAEGLKDMTDDEKMEGEVPAGDSPDSEGNDAEELEAGEGEDEIREPPNEGGDSVNGDENDDVEGCGEGDEMKGEEQKEGIDGSINEQSGGGNAEESGEGSEKQETSSVQPEAEES